MTFSFLAGTSVIFILIAVVFVGAVLGDNFGYGFGKRFGTKIFSKEKSLFFHKDNLEKAEAFYKKHGPLTIILARFMPVIRTFVPILAGVGRMNYKTFLIYNIVGGFVWATSLTLLGFYLGYLVPNIDAYILPIIITIIIFSILPSSGVLFAKFIKKKRREKKTTVIK